MDQCSTLMPESKAKVIQKQIEDILTENNIHYRLEFERCPDLRYIEFSKISIKIQRAR